MERHSLETRPDWQAKVEATGLSYHSHATGPYWDESACYQLTSREVEELETAAQTVHESYIQVAQRIIDEQLWARIGIPKIAVPSILDSWNREDFSLYGRFDFAYDGQSPPQLLEYNADTPTALIEAAVTQWFWLEETHKGRDQFNSIHERLVQAWRSLNQQNIWFAAVGEHPEDEQTIRYLSDTAHQAGVKTRQLPIDEVGWDSARREFVGLDREVLETVFKLYPWEWMWSEEFAPFIQAASTKWIEPPWKLMLSNKGILPILHELFPTIPNILPAYDKPGVLSTSYVQKPKFGREGANVTLVERGNIVAQSTGPYDDKGYVYQAVARTRAFQGNHPVFGVWMIAGECAGLGIREDSTRITGNLSRFVPHFF